MKTVVYCCPFVPAEWIAAHGLRPRRSMPRSVHGAAPTDAASGACAYARAFMQEIIADSQASAVVLSTVCDQMRRAGELIARQRDVPTFVLNVPSTWATPAAHTCYREELERLGRFTERVGGKRPSHDELVAVMLDYHERRASVRAARAFLPARQYSEAIAAFHRDGVTPSEPADCGTAPGGVPLALIGGPLVQEDLGIFDLVEQAGGIVVLDGTETGERTLPAPLDRRSAQEGPLEELTHMYFGSIPDAFRRPNHQLYEWFEHAVRDRAVRGIILRRHLWCDIWHAELPRLKERVDIPVLDLDDGGNDGNRNRLEGRIQALLESLR